MIAIPNQTRLIPPKKLVERINEQCIIYPIGGGKLVIRNIFGKDESIKELIEKGHIEEKDQIPLVRISKEQLNYGTVWEIGREALPPEEIIFSITYHQKDDNNGGLALIFLAPVKVNDGFKNFSIKSETIYQVKIEDGIRKVNTNISPNNQFDYRLFME